MARAGPARLLAPAGGEAASLADQAYYAIRELIVTLQFAPGDPISERDLTERLRIGRTPIREALRQLAQEKLVEVFPRRGMFVTGVDVRDLARLCEVRRVLEPEAARLAAERATQEDLTEIAGLLEELEAGRRRSDRALIDLDERIHRTIYRTSHNHFLEETLEEYYALALRIWMMALEFTTELRDAVEEHHPLLDAIARGNVLRAGDLMRAHVEHFEDTMRQVLLLR
ncbi:MAG TPA: GntR family transcriptional regulator [Gaiellaceae bacterium]|nr:GntR family transcriptional regulator [Thermoleophilia bacterium]HWJ33041.1 GntR family transcriptional regulator [Gaiellaceae bacterium]